MQPRDVAELLEILSLPISYLQYMTWHRRADASLRSDSGLWSGTFPARFEWRAEDIPHLAPSLNVTAVGSHTVIKSETGETVVEEPRESIMRMLEFVDGKSTFDELFSLARRMKVSSRLDINKFMGAALVVPESIDKLEASIPGISITRFPKSPYGILRVYWENMHSVRESVREICAEKDSIPSKDAFRILHVIALMGSDLCSFYKPDSPVSDEAVWPGHYRRRKTEVSYQGVLEFNWHLSAVARSLKIDFEFPYEVKWVERNTHWGKGYIDEHSAHYSAPPPPFNKQTESLHEAFLHLPRRVTTEKLEEAICKLAKFHQRFVQLHPFECANQSLAMNIVNNFLGEWMNSCIPHLFLDMFSLFLSPDDYARLFGRAVKYYSVRNEHTRDAYRSLGERFKSMRAFVPTFLTADQFKSAREIEEENSQVACDLLLQD